MSAKLGSGKLGDLVLGTLGEELPFAHAQAQADILKTTFKHAQAQAYIIRITFSHAQAQSSIKTTNKVFAQAHARIKQTYPNGPTSLLIDNPIAYWKLDETSGTTAFDQLGNWNATYVNSPSLGQGGANANTGNSVGFNLSGNSGHRLDGPTSTTFDTGSWSFELWLYVVGGSTWPVVVAKGDGGGNGGWLLYNFPGGVYYKRSGFEPQVGLVSSNTWTFITVTYNQSSQRFRGYINGVLTSEYTSVNFTNSTSNPLRLGVNVDGQWLNGRVDELAYFNYELTGQQVLSHVTLSGTGPFGQARALITTVNQRYAQAQAYIIEDQAYGQAQASILATSNKHAQARAYIISPVYAQAQAEIITSFGFKYAQAQADIYVAADARVTQIAIEVLQRNTALDARVTQIAIEVLVRLTFTAEYGQAQAYIIKSFNSFGQSQAFIRKSAGYGQAQSKVKQTYQGFAQAQANISYKGTGVGQAQALLDSSIKNVYGQARAQIIRFKAIVSGQSRANIIRLTRAYAQAQGLLDQSFGFGQAKTSIVQAYVATGQAKAQIIKTWKFGQAQAQINAFGTVRTGQARAFMVKPYGTGQAKALIKKVWRAHGQARARIIVFGRVRCGQARAYIYFTWAHGQALAFVGHFQTGQAQAKMLAFDVPRTGLAQGYIGGKYVVRFNGFDLPGYAQSEDYTSGIVIKKYGAAYHDGELGEYQGLTNKPINLRMKVVGENYLAMKYEVQKAATILRSSKGYSRLYIQRSGFYYLAATRKITVEKDVKDSRKDLDYSIEFDAKPWLYGETVHAVSGTSLITVTRSITNGGWSPITATITGTNVTVSGYTATESYTGYVSVAGSVGNLVINSEAYTAKISGVNVNDLINNEDYRLYVGPETTYFAVAGASSCVLEYQDRYYL